MRLAVIALESEQVISPSINDFLCDRRLAAHRIQGHDTVLHQQLVEQRWNGGDLVGFAVHAALTQDSICSSPLVDSASIGEFWSS